MCNQRPGTINSFSQKFSRRDFLKLSVVGLLAGCTPHPMSTPTQALSLPATPAHPIPTPFPVIKSEKINRSDIIFTNPHYNFLDTGVYENFSPNMTAWGFLPTSRGETDTTNYIKAVKRHQEAGIRFQVRIEWDVVWDGMKIFTDHYEDAACRDFDGNTLSFPWNPSAFWFCSHQPLFRDYIHYQIEMALLANPDAVMFDSQTSTPITYYYGGCFCERCMEDFSTWLRQNYMPHELADFRISDIGSFNYHAFLVDAGYSRSTYADAVIKWPNNIPLSNEYRLFQLQFVNAYIQELANWAKSKVDHSLMISTSSPIMDPYFHGSRLVTVSEIDFYTLEYNHNADKKIVPEDVVTLYKMADALERPVVITAQPNPDWLMMYKENRVGLVHNWIAQAYANGAIFMVPEKMWAYESSKHYWYQSQPGDFDTIYKFIIDNDYLFDGYETVAKIGLVYVHSAYRNNSRFIFDACIGLTRENIPFQLVIAGDEWWPEYLDLEKLQHLDMVITTPDSKYLDSSQQSTLDTISDRVILWSDMAKLNNWYPLEIVVNAPDVTAIPRFRPDEPQAPFICHLLNRNYLSSSDSMIVQRKFSVLIADSLFDRTITNVVYYEPGRTPINLEIKTNERGILINIPHLEHWGIVQLS